MSKQTSNIALLRNLLQLRGIDGYLIPATDEFNNEYLPEAAKRLAWATGFTGSNGLAIITNTQCYLYTDGRYLLQAEQELGSKFIVKDIATLNFAQIKASSIGYDPMLHSHRNLEHLKHLASAVTTLIPIADNLVDLIWKDRPNLHTGDFYHYDLDSPHRIKAVIQSMPPQTDFLLITAPDQVCWLAGIRGGDVEYTPLALYYGILGRNGSLEKFPNHHALQQRLHQLKNKTIQMDPSQTPAAIAETILQKNRLFKPSPVDEVRLVKTDGEIASMSQVHIHDGIAMCNFLHWLDGQKTKYTEYELGQKLLGFRQVMPKFHSPSFTTISGFAENGAIIHYSPPKDGSKLVGGNGLLLLDSGGQYHGGTTDITRVIPFGKIATIWKTHYTAVLQGHINLASAQFPKGTTGMQLDVLARSPLWAQGLDYAHGTGHGVGVFLSVHEGPLRISKACNLAVVENAVLSNEPGVYFAEQYGIRLENLMIVTPAATPEFLCFKPLTMVPFDKRLIDLDMLSAEQLSWLNYYHDTIRKTLAQHLSPAVKNWLDEACEPLNN